jgi:protein-histidine pros-kinase
MGLRLKFNLVLLVVFLAGFGVAGYISHDLLFRHAREQVLAEARLVMEAALAIRGYTVSQVRPHLDPIMHEQFLPQTVPAYAATETLAELRKKYPNYNYKEATLNPTNPATGRRTGRPIWSRTSATAPTARRSPASVTRPPAARCTSPTRSASRRPPACPATARRGGAAEHDQGVWQRQRLRLEAQRGGGRAGGFGAHVGALENANQAFRTFMVSLAGCSVRSSWCST